MSNLTISLAQLRVSLARLLDAAEERFGSEVEFGVDYYWNVPLDRAYDPTSGPTLDMGQVSEDIESVAQFAASDADDPVSIWHECQHVAGILRAIAQTDMP